MFSWVDLPRTLSLYVISQLSVKWFSKRKLTFGLGDGLDAMNEKEIEKKNI